MNLGTPHGRVCPWLILSVTARTQLCSHNPSGTGMPEEMGWPATASWHRASLPRHEGHSQPSDSSFEAAL